MKTRNSIDWLGSMMHFLPFSRNPSDCSVDEMYSDWSFSKSGSDAISSQLSR